MATAKDFKSIAKEALLLGNPYIKRATVFQIDRSPRYIFCGSVMTREEIDTAYMETAEHDARRGYEERSVGYYDKWYRYNHADSGRAYDMGQRFACETGNAGEGFTIIECMN